MTILHVSNAHHLNTREKFFHFLLLRHMIHFQFGKPLFRIYFFYFNSFDRNTFFLSENLFFFIMVTMSHHTRCVLRKIIFIKSYTFCCIHILWIIKFIKIFYNSRWLTIWTNGKFFCFFLIVYQARCQHIFYSGKFCNKKTTSIELIVYLFNFFLINHMCKMSKVSTHIQIHTKITYRKKNI